MGNFFINYGACIILSAIGLFFIAMTYGAYFTERSGVPFLGGLLIAAGFLTTPLKWLALLGLIDPGYLGIPYFIITDHIREKRFGAVYEKLRFAEKTHDDTKQLRIRIPDRNEEIFRRYSTNHIHELRISQLLFSVCIDKNGDRFILTDKGAYGKNIEISHFNTESVVISAPGPDGKDMTVEIGIIPDLQ